MSIAADLAGSKCPTADRLTTSTPLPNLTRHRSRQKRRGRVPEVVRTDRGASVAAPAFAAGLSVGCSASVELPGDCIEACMACRLDISNDRQNIGRKQCRLSHTGRTHALHRADWVRPPPRPPWYVPRSPHGATAMANWQVDPVTQFATANWPQLAVTFSGSILRTSNGPVHR